MRLTTGCNQAIVDRVGRVERSRHVADHLLPQRLVGYLALDGDLRTTDLQLPLVHLLQVWRKDLGHVLRPIGGRYDTANLQSIDYILRAIKIAQSGENGGARGFVRNAAAGNDLARLV